MMLKDGEKKESLSKAVYAERTLFLNDVDSNTGPANVDRVIAESWPRELILFNKSNLASKTLSTVKGCALCDVYVSAFPTKADWVCRYLGKPSVKIVHGYVPYENTINDLGFSKKFCRSYDRWLQSSDAVIVFSELQARFMEEHTLLNPNKIHICPMPYTAPKISKSPRAIKEGLPVIVVSGGTRPIKNNSAVVEAVRRICSHGRPCEIRVYGRNYSGSHEFLDTDLAYGGRIRYMGQVPQREFVSQLSEASVFVMASVHEPFGLSALDALMANCSILLSSHCGVSEVMNLDEEDKIVNIGDINEISKKIENLIEHSNAQKLRASVDYKMHAPEISARYIWEVCNEVVMEKRGR